MKEKYNYIHKINTFALVIYSNVDQSPPSPHVCWSFTSSSEPNFRLKSISYTVETLKPSCWCVPWCVLVFYVSMYKLISCWPHQRGQNRTFGVWLCTWLCIRVECIFLCVGDEEAAVAPGRQGGLTRMYGCFKIHLQAFFCCHSPFLSAHNTPHPISKEYIGTYSNLLLAITSTLIAFSPHW